MVKEAGTVKRLMILAGLAFFFFFIGNGIISLTSPDEVFYSQTAKEMAQHRTWSVPYLFGQPQFEKPALTFWLLRLAFLLFGVNSFSARLFPALFASIGVIAVYLLGRLVYKEEKKAFISALILMSSGLYIGLARTVFTDMIFSVFILLSLVSFFWGYTQRQKMPLAVILFFIFSGLAALTKGPLGLSIPFLTVVLFLILKKDLRFLFSRYALWGFLLCTLIAVPWYAFMIHRFGKPFIAEFFYNDHLRRLLEAEHKAHDTWFFYPASILLCFAPWSIFVFASLAYFVKKLINDFRQPFHLFLACWIAVVLVIFQVAHSKLASYVLPLFPALAIVAGSFISDVFDSNKGYFLRLSLASWLVFLLFPAGILVSAKMYSTYLPSPEIVYIFVCFYILMLAVMLNSIVRQRLQATLYFIASQVPLLLCFAFSAAGNFDGYVSSKQASEYLLKNYPVEGRIICTKAFVRGVRFFTDKEVATMNVGGSDFFSSHPVPYLNTDEKLLAFLKTQAVTYCVLRKSSVVVARRVVSSEMKLDILKVIGDEYIVRVRSGQI